jgi:hypothetical protein
MKSQKRNLDVLIGLSIIMAGLLYQLFLIEKNGFLMEQEWLIQYSFVENGNDNLLHLQNILGNKWMLIFSYLLHGIFLLFGNIPVYSVFLILIAQFLLLFTGYLLLRSKVGNYAGIIFVIYYLLYLTGIFNTTACGPSIIGFLVQIVLISISIFCFQKFPLVIKILTLSMVCAFGVWLDFTGIAFFFGVLLYVLLNQVDKSFWKRFLEFCCILLVTPIFYVLSIIIEAYILHNEWSYILQNYIIRFQSQFDFSFVNVSKPFFTVSLVCIILSFVYVISSYFTTIKKNNFLIIAIDFSIIFILFLNNQIIYNFILWIEIGILLGIFGENIFQVFLLYVSRREMVKIIVEEDRTTHIQQAHFANEDKINYILNPLPVPKRHEKKEITFGFEPTESALHYDYNITEEQMNYDIN